MGECTYKEGVIGLADRLRDRVPEEYLEDADFDDEAPVDDETVAAAGGLPAAPAVAPVIRATKGDKARAISQFKRGRNRSSQAKDQIRDYRGRFRQVLARLKVNLGESELNDISAKVEDAEDAEQKSDYGKAADAATDVVQLVDRIKSGSLATGDLNNIKATTRELGKAIAYLPMPQGQDNAKLRFSDLPPTTQQLLENMEKRILEKMEPAQAREVMSILNRFTSGALQLSSDQIQAELAKLLTYLLD